MMRFWFLILLPFSFLCAQYTDTHIFFVSPTGSDANPGTQDAPFQTIQKARDAVRALPSSAFDNQDVYILLRGGTYRMQEPLILNASDSGRKGRNVVYRAYPGETPILSGATPVTGWTFVDLGFGIYRATVGQLHSRQLYVNGTRAVRARTTSYPVAFLPNFFGGGIQYVVTPMNPATWRDPTGWTNQSDIEAVILTQWKMMRVPLSNVTPGLIVMQEPAWTNANVYFDSTTNAPGIWSFWQVTWFENALEFLTEPGQWYLDSTAGFLYYIPLPGEDINTATVELPLLETLVRGEGTLDDPIHNIRFEGITFSYATWLGPSTNDGYVADQCGFLLVGSGHSPNYIGHDPNIIPTAGNLQFAYAHNIEFVGNIFEHLGAIGLRFDTGSQNNIIRSNLFTDLSSSAIEMGQVAGVGPHPNSPGQVLQNNLITNNLIRSVSVDYMDAAALFVAFSVNTTISHNTIVDVPWSAIAMGWGWGLYDRGSFPGLPHSHSGQWGNYETLTPNYGCLIEKNRFHSFLNVLWDGGAIYTSGRQGPSYANGLVIKKNVASGKRPDAGGNTYYNDGGSRYVLLKKNVSYDNPIGITFFGPPPPVGDPLPYNPIPSLGNGVPYGSDIGGCVTFGDIKYKGNYFLQSPLDHTTVLNNFVIHSLTGLAPYFYQGFFNICPFTYKGVSYPVRLHFKHNHPGFALSDVPSKILSNAGVTERPSTIPPEKWILPP